MLGTRNLGWIGIDFGAQAVKVAQLARRNGQFQLVAAQVVKRREAWSSDPHGPVHSSVGEIEAALASVGAFRGRTTACVLSMSRCGIFGMRVDVGQADREIGRQLASALTCPSEFGYWETHEPDEKSSASDDNVHVLTLPTAWSDRVCEDQSQLGLECRILDGLPLTLARATRLLPDASTAPLVVLDWGFSQTTLCAVLHGKPLYVRVLPDSGAARLLDSIARRIGISQDDAGQALTKHGIEQDTPSDIQRLILEAVTEPLQDMASELHQSINYLFTHRRNLSPHEIVLTGAGATFAGIESWVNRVTGVPTRCFRVPFVAPAHELPPSTVSLLAPAMTLSALAWEAAA
ncbi:MAG: pilus assembly protein PilM [Planctomycetales bacterium]|nr:pilus assembly protein PilM [Planctomycetales bacterium]